MGRPLPHTHFLEQPAPRPGSLEEQPPPSASRADSPGLARTWREGRVSASEAARPRAQGGLGDSAGGGGDGQAARPLPTMPPQRCSSLDPDAQPSLKGREHALGAEGTRRSA